MFGAEYILAMAPHYDQERHGQAIMLGVCDALTSGRLQVGLKLPLHSCICIDSDTYHDVNSEAAIFPQYSR